MDEDDLLQALVDELADDGEADDEPTKSPAVTLHVSLREGETEDQATARVALTPEYHAAHSIFQLNQITAFRGADITMLANRLDLQTQQLKDGDLGQAESMLASQAYTLDALYHHLLRRAALNIGNEFDVVDRLMKLALKAQSQCVATLAKLADIKRPVIKQTNIAHGHQQVNNVPMQENEKHRAKSKSDLKNELLEKTDGERLDFGKAATPIRRDQDVEAVGEVDRSNNDSGQGNSGAECK